MYGIHYYIILSLVVIVFLILSIRMLRFARASNGQLSFSLTGIQVTSVVIFAMLFIDTFNDRTVCFLRVPNVTNKVKNNLNKVKIRSVRSGIHKRRMPNNRLVLPAPVVRGVIKEKYYLLGVMFVIFCMLYLFSHRRDDMKDWTVKTVLAIRAINPYEHIIDNALIELLMQDPYNAEIRDFFLQGLLAKQGKTSTVEDLKNKSIGEVLDEEKSSISRRIVDEESH